MVPYAYSILLLSSPLFAHVPIITQIECRRTRFRECSAFSLNDLHCCFFLFPTHIECRRTRFRECSAFSLNDLHCCFFLFPTHIECRRTRFRECSAFSLNDLHCCFFLFPTHIECRRTRFRECSAFSKKSSTICAALLLLDSSVTALNRLISISPCLPSHPVPSWLPV